MTKSFDYLTESRFVFNEMVKLTALRSHILSVLCVSAFRAHTSNIKVLIIVLKHVFVNIGFEGLQVQCFVACSTA